MNSAIVLPPLKENFVSHAILGISKGSKNKTKNIFRKKLCGDIFGSSMNGENSMLGMLYRSRVQEAATTQSHEDDEVNDVHEKEMEENSVNSNYNDDSGDSEEGLNSPPLIYHDHICHIYVLTII